MYASDGSVVPFLGETRADSPAAPALEHRVALPPDPGLPDVPRLFDSAWAWQARCSQLGAPDELPERLRIHQLQYRTGRRVLVSYVAEWASDSWMVDDNFTIELVPGKPERVFLFPNDPYLPGLTLAASSSDAADLMSKYVRFRPQSLKVDLVRYRPSSRAVLRHVARWRSGRGDKLTLFVRVMRPERVSRILAAEKLAKNSNFTLPRVVACWAEGGVVWLGHIPGDSVRTLIRRGDPPDPNQILDHLELLWSGPVSQDSPALNLARGFRRTERLLSQVLQSDGPGEMLQRVTDRLEPFVASWRPSTLAHNDFYDDQMILMPTGRLALVDFEETGLGDPLLDVGTMLAHLRWMARFGTHPQTCESFRHLFQSAALDRFGWDAQHLALREAIALFRLSEYPLRTVSDNWLSAVETGLSLVDDALRGAP